MIDFPMDHMGVVPQVMPIGVKRAGGMLIHERAPQALELIARDELLSSSAILDAHDVV